MKIIHCADLHLDSKMTANLSREQARERKTEILHTFARMVDYAAQNHVSIILIAGDLFDTRSVSVTARNQVRDQICKHPEIDFLYLKGNHDYDNFLENLEEIPENLKLFSDFWMGYRYGNIVISGLELSPENRAEAYNSIVLAPDDYNIVMLHGQEQDYDAKDRAEVISLDRLRNKNIDYLALGHIHSYTKGKLDARGAYCYCGCLEGRGFDECGEKGFVLLDIDENKKTASMEFVPFAARNLYVLEVDVTDCMTTQDVEERMELALSKKHFKQKDMIKFVLTGEVDMECEISTEFLKRWFEDRFYFEKVYDETRAKVNYRDYERDESLKGEFIRMVAAAELSEEEKSQIIRCGIQALSGEEI